jgi:predicted ester cyclase
VSESDSSAVPSTTRRPAPDPPKATPPAGGSPGAIVRWTVDMINARDAAAMRQVWADGVRVRFPPRTVRGVDELEAWWDEVFAAVPDLTLTIQGLVEHGDEVFMRWQLTGHHSGGEWEGIAATGSRVDLDGMDHFTFAAGVIESNFVVFDQMQFARQIGLLPADGSRLDAAAKRGFNLMARRRGSKRG